MRELLPAPPGLRPLVHVVDAAERVRDPVLPAMPDQKDMRLTELGVAVRAVRHALVERRRLGQRPRFPVRALNRPGDQVLEPAEDRTSFSGRFVGAEAIVVLDVSCTGIHSSCLLAQSPMRPILVRMEEVEREAIYRAVLECVLYPLGSLAAANEQRRRTGSRCPKCSSLHLQLQRERSAKSSSASASSTPRHTSAVSANGTSASANATATATANATATSAAVGRIIGNALSLATPTLLARNKEHRPLAARSSDSMRSNRSSAVALSAASDEPAACVCPPDTSQNDLVDFAQQVRTYGSYLFSVL